MAEIEKAGDSGYAINPPNHGVGGLTAATPGGCRYGQRPGHGKALCPTAAAERRNATENLTAESYRTGAVCTICAAAGVEAREHRAKNHDLAAQDVYKPGGAAPQQPRARVGDARSGGGSGVRPPPLPPPPIPPLPQRDRRPTGGDLGGSRRASTPFAPRPPMAAGSTVSRAAPREQRAQEGDEGTLPPPRRENKAQHCFSWRDTGHCARGRDCPYMHDEAHRNRRGSQAGSPE